MRFFTFLYKYVCVVFVRISILHSPSSEVKFKNQDMMPKYKLLYFNVTGLAEPIRYLFHYNNVPFQDYRFEWDEWLKIKPNVPFGHVPVLIEDGRQMCQSKAICRYLAKKFELVGKNDRDAFEADIIVDTLTDLRLNYRDFHFESNYDRKAKKMQEVKEVHTPLCLSKLDRIVQGNGGFFVKDKITWADLYFAAITDLLTNMIQEPILNSYSSLSNLKDEIDSHPNIKKYLDTRPKTVL